MNAAAVPPPVAVAASDRDIDANDTFRRLLKTPTFMVGILIVLFWVACAILGSRITPDDPLAQSPDLAAVLLRAGGLQSAELRLPSRFSAARKW